MKILFIECDAEEMRANRTILDNISEVFSSLTRTIAGIDVTPEQVAKAYCESEESEEEV